MLLGIWRSDGLQRFVLMWRKSTGNIPYKRGELGSVSGNRAVGRPWRKQREQAQKVMETFWLLNCFVFSVLCVQGTCSTTALHLRKASPRSPAHLQQVEEVLVGFQLLPLLSAQRL